MVRFAPLEDAPLPSNGLIEKLTRVSLGKGQKVAFVGTSGCRRSGNSSNPDVTYRQGFRKPVKREAVDRKGQVAGSMWVTKTTALLKPIKLL